MSSAPSFPTSQEADRPAPAEDVEIIFASTAEEAIEIHRFLCVIAQPVLFAPISPEDSIRGVIDVVRNGAAIVAKLNGHIIGSLGIVKVPWWYNNEHEFMTDRFFFTYPEFHHMGTGARLLAEAQAIANHSGMPLIINGHMRRRGSGVAFSRPRVTQPELH